MHLYAWSLLFTFELSKSTVNSVLETLSSEGHYLDKDRIDVLLVLSFSFHLLYYLL